MKLSGRERILVVKPSSLGDVVHALPAVAALHRSFPETKIDWLVNTEWAPLLEGAPFLHRSIPFPRREFRGFSGVLRARKWAHRELRHVGYEVAVDFQGLLRSALLAKLSGAQKRIGFSAAREGAQCLYVQSICVQDWQTKHAVDRNRELVQAMGADTSVVDFPLPEGEPVEMMNEFRESALLLHPFSRGKGKSLSITEVHELCELVSPRPVWLVGMADKEAHHSWPENVLNLLNRTSIAQLIYLLRRAAWTVSVDSGPMHLAAAVSDRILSLHTWSDPSMVGPWQKDAWIWRDSHLLPVRDLSPGRFPERRDLRDRFSTQERILNESDITAIAEFVRSRLSE